MDSRTRLRTLHQSGCLKFRFPRHADGRAEAIAINTSGGLTGGDRLSYGVDLGTNASATLTTQACERIYRAHSGDASLETTLRIGSHASLNYLPQETILFNGGRLKRSLEVNAEDTSRFLLLEPVILGREMMGERVEVGLLRDRWRVRIAGRLVFADDLALDGRMADLAAARAGLGGMRAFATILMKAETTEAQLETVRVILGESGGASLIAGLLVIRLAEKSGFALRKQLLPLLETLGEAPLPLVWSL
ncbi:urease accessory protein [Fulvimarina pelagi HTCC2506]|uniref:Urease accessory protein UreD n=2 Tax=Fulvimarina pelagi TaxID=217511 RepID=Q0G0F8_9HYPH|nr:urease accessory protein UreD [Fulvimarina pelagi]EAU40635.1 urease accessory protein [Fulvimarina pelagi HTCC2506]BAT31180.1 urease accessory protein [Fulvimarina pelagi]